MLIEIRCEQFRRGAVKFSQGLNVVLGDENATNSIGKSMMLMIIDFAFGGSSLLVHNKDIVSELGHHNYFFFFEFDDGVYRFRRGTDEPKTVYSCDDELQPLRAHSLGVYNALLKRAYRIEAQDLTFRDLVGLYLRVWPKDNLSVQRPLHSAPAESPKDCVDRLLKVFDKYEGIRELTAKVEARDSELKALNSAKRHEIVPGITKREYVANIAQIEDLERDLADIREHLAKYAMSLSALVNKEVLDLKFQRDGLLDVRQTLADRLERTKRNLQTNRVLRSRSFQELTKFFPEVNRERLEKVEDFHNGVARLLRSELLKAQSELERQLQEVEAATKEVDTKMAAALSAVDKPEGLVDRVYATAVALKSAKDANEHYEGEQELRTAVEQARTDLSVERESVLRTVEANVNEGMRKIVADVFGATRKSPKLSLHEKNYTFEVFDDTGTGTAYVGLVVFDLTVFLETTLPVIAHDSVLFKNIENDSVADLIQIYLRTDKQSFIALDEVSKYGEATAKLLRSRCAIQLDDENVLYVKDWRVPE